MIELIIFGKPVSWKAHGGYGKDAYNPRQKEREYFQSEIRKQYTGPLLFCPIIIDYLFYLPIPNSYSPQKKGDLLYRPHTKRPDLTNLIKFTEDTLKGTVIEDDSQVTHSTGNKKYGIEPKTVIYIHLAEISSTF